MDLSATPDNLDLGPTDVHLWQIPLPSPNTTDGLNTSFLNNEEQEKADRYSDLAARCDFIATRTATRRILSSYLHIQPDAIAFEQTDHGKPYLAKSQNPLGLHFNLSHSDRQAMLAVTRHSQVGIDIESLALPRKLAALTRRYFGPHTRQSLLALPEEDMKPAFLRAWTQFEAYQKAIGTGLRGGYQVTEYDIHPSHPDRFGAIVDNTGQATQWMQATLTLAAGYIGAVVLEHTASPINLSYQHYPS